MDRNGMYNAQWILSANVDEIEARFTDVMARIRARDNKEKVSYGDCFHSRDAADLGMKKLTPMEDVAASFEPRIGLVDRYAGLDVRVLCELAYKGHKLVKTPFSNGNAYELNVGIHNVAFGVSLKGEEEAKNLTYRNALNELNAVKFEALKNEYYDRFGVVVSKDVSLSLVFTETPDSVKVVSAASPGRSPVAVTRATYKESDSYNVEEKMRAIVGYLSGAEVVSVSAHVGFDPLAHGQVELVCFGKKGADVSKVGYDVCGVGPSVDAAVAAAVSWLCDPGREGRWDDPIGVPKELCPSCGFQVNPVGHELRCAKVGEVLAGDGDASRLGAASMSLDFSLLYCVFGKKFFGSSSMQACRVVLDVAVLARVFRALYVTGVHRRSDHWYADRARARYLGDPLFRAKYRLFAVIKWCLMFGDPNDCMSEFGYAPFGGYSLADYVGK